MKLVIYGECKVAGSGSSCYADALRQLGHQVVEFDDLEGLELYKTSIFARAYRRLARSPWESHRRGHAAALMKLVSRERPEIVIVLKGLYLGPSDINTLRGLGTWVINLNHDDFFSTNRNNWSPLQRAAIPYYDFILTTREVNVDEVRRINPRVEFFPFAYHPEIHRPVNIGSSERKLWNVDVVFVGSWEPERCSLLEQLVTRVAANYSVWGAFWEKTKRNSPLRPFLHQRMIVMDEMAKAIGGAKIALGFLRKQNRDDYTQRTFEIPACGGVLLAERTRRHTSFYREGQEAEFFQSDSVDELCAKVHLLLHNDDHRERIRTGGRSALLKQRHTYRDRVGRILELYSSVRT